MRCNMYTVRFAAPWTPRTLRLRYDYTLSDTLALLQLCPRASDGMLLTV